MLESFALTDVGRSRKINQDYVFSSMEPVGNLPNLFIVADGMGGHNAGDYASSHATSLVVEYLRASEGDEPIRIIRQAMERANDELYKSAQETAKYKGMGTTFVAATIVDGNYLYVANVGDSRLYLVNNDINQITRDHSVVEELVRSGKIGKDEARIHPDKNIITRAVGAVPKLMVDFFDMKLKPGDRILMCTDGLSNMVGDAQILSVMNEYMSVEEQVRALVDAANENGGKDNIGVVVIDPDI
ncbi:MAG: Stp1/IreP family PP2C-type Ser/Thr phosphatase [Lachnospiraceae bacterium]|nr:Stp1/IreP family PP2C-type Ser/Thr phosphatase [Lachnospiraceae bacterium]